VTHWRFRFAPPRCCVRWIWRGDDRFDRVRRWIARYRQRADLFEIVLTPGAPRDLAWLDDWAGLPIVWDLSGLPSADAGRPWIQQIRTLTARGYGEWCILPASWPPALGEALRRHCSVMIDFAIDAPGTSAARVTARARQGGMDGIRIRHTPSGWAQIHAFLDLVHTLQEMDIEGVWVLSGTYGRWFQILAPWFGSLWTYVSSGPVSLTLQRGEWTEITLEKYLHLYRVPEMAPDHRLVIGLLAGADEPLMDHIYNRLFQELGVPLHFVPMVVDDVEHFWPLLHFLPVQGIRVFHAYRQQMYAMLQEVEPAVRVTRYVNTIVRRDHRWVGYNTEWSGFWNTLYRLFGDQQWMPMIIGTGSCARAIAYAFATAGLPFRITGRHLDAARSIAAACQGTAVPWEQVDPTTFNLLIHATPVGQFPLHHEMISIPVSWVHRKIVFDMVYRPESTRLLQFARQQGALWTVSGLEVLTEQVVQQIDLWVGTILRSEEILPIIRTYMEEFDDTVNLF